MIATQNRKTFAKFPTVSSTLFTADDLRAMERTAYYDGYERALNEHQGRLENWFLAGCLVGMGAAGTLLAFFSL